MEIEISGWYIESVNVNGKFAAWAKKKISKVKLF